MSTIAVRVVIERNFLTKPSNLEIQFQIPKLTKKKKHKKVHDLQKKT